MLLTGGNTIREQRQAFRQAKKAREAAKVQVVVVMALEHFAARKVTYHRTQMELLGSNVPKYARYPHRIQEPFDSWLVRSGMTLLSWTKIFRYTGISMVADFYPEWGSAIDKAIVQLNELPEVQEFGVIGKDRLGDLTFLKQAA